MKKTNFLLLAGFSSVLFVSCSSFGGSTKNKEKGNPIETSKSAVEAILADKKGNEGKRFSITGYLNYSPGLRVYTSRPQLVFVYTEAGKKGNVTSIIEMPWEENGKNSVFTPQNAGGDGSKTIFYDNEGTALTMNDKVIISFSVNEEITNPTDIRIDKTQ